MARARVGVPPGERWLRAACAPPTLSALGLPLSDAAHTAGAISQACGKGVAWQGCGSRGAERTVVPPWSSGGSPSARQPRVRCHELGCGVGWGGQVCGAKVAWWRSGARTYLSRRSAPFFGPSRHIATQQATIAPGAGSETSDATTRGLGRSPSIAAPQGNFLGDGNFWQKKSLENCTLVPRNPLYRARNTWSGPAPSPGPASKILLGTTPGPSGPGWSSRDQTRNSSPGTNSTRPRAFASAFGAFRRFMLCFR